MCGWTKNGRLSVYEIYMYTCIKKSKKIIKYKKKEKVSWKMPLPPDESLTCKEGTILICVHYIAGTCVHEHISPLFGEHLSIVNICWGPVTVHYTERFHCTLKMLILTTLFENAMHHNKHFKKAYGHH